MQLQGKVALVTGAGSGIGRTTAIELAKAGAVVVITDRDEAGCKQTLKEVEAAGGTGTVQVVDVTDGNQVRAAVQHAVAEHGGLHLAFNNAGWEGKSAMITEFEEATWDKVIDINLKGVFRCMQEELRVMEAGASIVNCSSVAGIIGLAASSAYVASKHGVVGLTRTAALEAAPRGIRVNAVCPGGIKTPMLERAMAGNKQLADGLVALHPLGRIGEPREIADAVVWLSSEGASFVTGAILPVDGGWTAT